MTAPPSTVSAAEHGRPPGTAAPGPFPLHRATILLLVVLGALFAALWLGGWRVRAFVSGWTDLASYFVPKYQYAADRIADGELPLWNPYEFGGIPFLATIQPGVFYPPLRAVYAVLSGEAAYRVLFVAHLLVAAFGTLLLARDLRLGLWPALVAAAWVTQPTWLVRLYDHPVYLVATTWIPFLVLLLRRLVQAPGMERAVLLGLLAALQAVSGYPPLVLATGYVLALSLPLWLLEVRRTLDLRRLARIGGALLVAVVVAGLLAAAQIVPTVELASLTDRVAEAADAHARIADLARQSTEMLFLIGVPQMTLGATLAELWNRFGPFLLLTGLAAPLLRPERPATWFAVAAVVVSACLPFGAYPYLPFYAFVRFALEWAFIAPFAVYLFAALGLDALLDRVGRMRRLAAPLALATLCLATAWNWRLVDPSWLRLDMGSPLPVPPVSAQCDVADPRFRSFWPEGQFRGSLVHARIRSSSGYEQSLLPARQAKLQKRIGLGNGGVLPHWARSAAAHSRMLSRFALRCVITTLSPALETASFVRQPFAGNPRARVYVNTTALARARLEHAVLPAATSEAALGLMDEAPPSGVILEADDGQRTAETPLPSCPDSSGDRVAIVRDRPEDVEVRTRSACDAYLVLADANLPGWTATLDGRPVPIRQADYAFRAVRVPAGEHVVGFRYAPRSVRLGLALSATGVLLAIVLLLGGRVVRGRARRRAEASDAKR